MADVPIAMDDEVVTTLAVVAAVVVLFALLGVAAWYLARRVRRVLLAWYQVYLDARVRWLPPGPQREAAVLRQRLRQEMRGTAAMLAGAPDGLIFRADAQAVLTELNDMSAAVDADLRAIEAFGDAREQQAALVLVGPQARELIEMSYSARQTILRTSAEDRDRQMTRLRAQVDQQSAAAKTYKHGGHGLTV